MFQGEHDLRRISWLLAELTWVVRNQEDNISANSDAIEALVANLRDAEARILAKIAAVQAAKDAGEDLTAPLADLTAEVGNISNIAPATPPATPAPADGSVPPTV